MTKDIYNIVIDDKVYVIYTDEFYGGCTYVGSVNNKFRLHNSRIREKALKACHQNK